MLTEREIAAIVARSHPAQGRADRWAFEGLAHVSHTWRYVYWVTPKAACSSILLTLQRLERKDPSFTYEDQMLVHHRDLSPLESIAPNIDRITDKNYLKWCFVRNPYTRLMSCWLEKVHDGSLRSRFEAKLGRKGPISFEDFIAVAAAEPLNEMETHYAPQFHLTFQDMIPYDFIGRFERLDADLAEVSRRLGADLATYQGRVDHHRTGAKPFNLITPALARTIQEKWVADFDGLGYAATVPD